MKNFKAYADGACAGNPGDAAIGMYITDLDTDTTFEGFEYLGYGTNNIAELTAVYRVLQSVPLDCNLEIITDSTYAIGILSKNWNAKANQALILEIKKELIKHPNVKFTHVKGHAGDYGNSIVDRLAQKSSKSKLSEPLISLR